MANTARDLIKARISNAPGTGGSFTLSTAFTNSLLPVSGDDGLKFKLNITENGVGTEIRKDCTYTHNGGTGSTFGRGTMVRSTGTADAALNFTAAAIVSVVPSAEDYLTTQVAGLSTVSTAPVAAANKTLIQAALDAGGTVSIMQSGVFEFVPPLVIGSNTELRLGKDTTLLSRPEVSSAADNCIISKMIADSKAALRASVTFTWTSGSTATLNWTGHGLAPGDFVWTQGASPTEFNTIGAVLSVTNPNAVVLQLERVPTASPSGTITALKADQNVVVRGGTIDYNSPTNSSTTEWKNYALLLGGQNVHALDVDLPHSNAQFLAFAAARNYSAQRITSAYTSSGGIQIQGCCYNGKVYSMSVGRGYDDMISLNPFETDGFENYQLSNGDICGCDINGIDVSDQQGTGIVTLYAAAVPKLSGVSIRNVTGSCPTGGAVRLFGYNASVVTAIEDVVIDNIDANAFYALQLVCNATSMTVRSLTATRLVNNFDLTSNIPVLIGVKCKILDGSLELIQRAPNWPGASWASLVTLTGQVVNCRFKFLVYAGVSENVGLMYIAPDAACGQISIEDSYIPSSVLMLRAVKVNTSTAIGALAFRNNDLTTEVGLSWGDGTVPSMDFEFSGNRFTDNANHYGFLRMLAGNTFNIRSDGTNKWSSGTVFLTMPVSGVDARVYGWDIAVDPIALPLPAVAGQYFNSTRTGATNQGPSRSNAANFVALGTGAAGINTVIS